MQRRNLILLAGALLATGSLVSDALVSEARAARHEVPAQFATIQLAVDAAAAGDTVTVAAGTYEEQVVVGKDLAIIGAGPELTTLQAPESMPHGVGNWDYRGVVCVEQPATGVTVAGLTIDGLKRAPEAGLFVGLIYYRTGGVIEDVTVINVHPQPTTDTPSGIGILAANQIAGNYLDLAIRRVTVLRYQKSGVVVTGPYTATLEDILVDTDGVYSDAVQNGIEVNFAIHTVVRGCEIRHAIYEGEDDNYTSVGLLGYFSGEIFIEDSRLVDCQAGVYFVHSTADLDQVSVDAPASSTFYCHGVVAADFANEAGRGDAGDLPRPRPSVEGSPGGRPQETRTFRMRDCQLDGNDNPASRGLAVRSYTAQALDVAVERCTMENWETGVISLEAGIGAVWGRLSGCRITDNLTFGAYANTVSALDARGCWWGDATGPYHPLKNPLGLGNGVSDNVLVDPWLRGNLAPLPLPQAISLADLDGTAHVDTITVDYLGGADDGLYAFSATLSWDPAVVSAVRVERPARGGFTDAVAFEILPDEGSVQVDAALGGDQPGIISGPLFRVHFEAVGTPDWTYSPLSIELLHARNAANVPIGGFQPNPGGITVDLQPPVVHDVSIRNETLGHTDEYAKDGDLLSITATVTDGDPSFDRGNIRGVPAHLWNSPYLYMPPDAYVVPQAYFAARPAWLTPTDGPAPVWVEGRDPSGNYSIQRTDTLTADNTPPTAVVGFTATADHNQTQLAWNDPTGNDLHYRQTVVRAARWLDYPFYDGAAPAYPATPADGEPVYLGDDTAHDAVFAADGSERDIIYYAAMVEDLAGNVSSVSGGSRARATNYRLGDVNGQVQGTPGDGIVDIFDVDQLGDTYGLLRSDPGFDGACDVGPTVGGATGVPVPDEEIELEDLMVFADQYHLDGAVPAPLQGDDLVTLAWRRLDPLTWALVLEEPCPRLKGLRLDGPTPGASLQLTAGPLLHAQPGPWFLHPGRGGFSAHLAMLGHGVGMIGSGELLRLTAPTPTDLPPPTVVLRDVDNQPLFSALPTAVADDATVPSVFRVLPPHPNPFNPSTAIAFDLPARQPVHLAIYDAAGRRVAVLVDGVLPAARHTARWLGRDHAGRTVAAGTYLYRLEAGPWSASGKLQLVK